MKTRSVKSVLSTVSIVILLIAIVLNLGASIIVHQRIGVKENEPRILKQIQKVLVGQNG